MYRVDSTRFTLGSKGPSRAGSSTAKRFGTSFLYREARCRDAGSRLRHKHPQGMFDLMQKRNRPSRRKQEQERREGSERDQIARRVYDSSHKRVRLTFIFNYATFRDEIGDLAIDKTRKSCVAPVRLPRRRNRRVARRGWWGLLLDDNRVKSYGLKLDSTTTFDGTVEPPASVLLTQVVD